MEHLVRTGPRPRARHRTDRPRAARGRRAVLLLVLAGLAMVGLGLGGCSGGSSSSASGGPAVGATGAAGPAENAPGGALDGVADGAGAGATSGSGAGAGTGATNGGGAGASAGAPAAGGTAVAPPRVVMTASLLLQVDDVTRRAADVRAVAEGSGGSVTQEDLTSSPGTGGSAQTTGTMTVQVPQARLDGVLDRLSGLGTVLQRTTSSQDVTSTYVDTSSRVATMQASVARLRTLLAQAKDLGQVVALEDELTKREADLESIQAQLADLTGRTTMATVNLSLSAPATATAPGAPSSPGFLDGLGGGWHAFVAVATWLLTALGALLPFLALAAAVALPVVAWRRRRTGSGAGAVTTARTSTEGPTTPGAPEEERRPTVAS